MSKMIMIPEYRYEELVKAYEKTKSELLALHTQLILLHTQIRFIGESEGENDGED